MHPFAAPARPSVTALLPPTVRVLTAILLLLACGEQGGSRIPLDPEDDRLAHRVFLSPALPAAEAEFQLLLGYSLQPATSRLGAFVAELRFDPSRAQYVGSDPSAMAGAVINAAEAHQGILRVAGARVEGYVENVVFRATFRSGAQPITAEDFSVTLLEAVDTKLASVLPPS